MSYNNTSYDYTVFYYDVNDLSPAIILKDLYSHKASKDTDNALSTQELDFIEPEIRLAADKVAQMVGRYFRDFSNEDNYPDIYGITGYEYGKLNIDPDNTSTGNYIVYRLYFRELHKQDEMIPRIDNLIKKVISKSVRKEWAITTGLPNWQIIQAEMVQAQDELHEALSFRKQPAKRSYTFF